MGWARIQILLAAVLFGTTGTAQALGPDSEPLAVGASRIVVGALLLAAIALLTAKRTRPGAKGAPERSAKRSRPGAKGAAIALLTAKRARPGAKRAPARGSPRAPATRPVLLAGACVAAYQLCFFAGVADTGVAVGTVVAIGSAPAFAGLFAWAFAGERLHRRWVIATMTALAGVGLLVLGGGGAAVSAPGVGLTLLSGAGYAGYAVATKRLLQDGGRPEALMAVVFGAGALFLLPVLALVPAGELASPGGLALVLYLGLIPTALAYVLFARGLERIGAGETATLTLAEPLTAAALGIVALGERPGLAGAAGAVLVLGGLALLALRPSAPRPVAIASPRPALKAHG